MPRLCARVFHVEQAPTTTDSVPRGTVFTNWIPAHEHSAVSKSAPSPKTLSYPSTFPTSKKTNTLSNAGSRPKIIIFSHGYFFGSHQEHSRVAGRDRDLCVPNKFWACCFGRAYL